MRYYVNQNAQDNVDHEVHVSSCDYFSREENCHYLGDFNSCFPAVLEAKKYYSRANGCTSARGI